MDFNRIIAICAGIAFFLLAGPLQAGQVTVFAAASLKEALDVVARQFSAETGHSVTTSYAGSSALARQIEYGAPADIFISASSDWMDRLDRADRLAPGTRFDLLGNRLVLIGAPGAGPLTLDRALDLPALLQGGRLAIALTEAVPAGIYGKAALQSLGLWDGVKPLLAETDNVRAALALVALRAAPLGIVYETDARADPRVSIRGVFPATSHPAITYPVAAIRQSQGAQTAAFLDYLRSEAAHAVFEDHGFLIKAE